MVTTGIWLLLLVGVYLDDEPRMVEIPVVGWHGGCEACLWLSAGTKAASGELMAMPLFVGYSLCSWAVGVGRGREE